MNTQQQQGASYTAPSASSPSPSPRSQRPYSPKEHSAQQGYPADLTIEDLDKDSGGASAPLDLADSSQGSGWSQSDTGVAYGRQDGGDEDREEPSTKKKQKAKGTATSSAQASEGGDKIRLWTRRAERMVCYKSLVKHRPSGAKGHKATREAWLGVVKDCLTPQHIRVRTDDGVQEVWVDMSHKCKTMATTAYPGSPRVDEFLGGATHVIHAQLRAAYERDPARVREFSFDAAVEIARMTCVHEEEPPALPSGLSCTQRQNAAEGHAGLCGYYLADVIAGVKYEEVEETAAKRGVPVTFNVFRNQCCYDAAKRLGADGMGVQLQRQDCFTQACRALFPGNGTPAPWVETAFSANNVARH